MNVYVSELPKKCLKCPCFDRCGYICKVNKKLLDTVGKGSADNSRDEDCPLQSLADYTKQVRKEVCEEIRDKMTHWEDCLTKEVTEYVIDKETLDKIEQGETNENI